MLITPNSEVSHDTLFTAIRGPYALSQRRVPPLPPRGDAPLSVPARTASCGARGAPLPPALPPHPSRRRREARAARLQRHRPPSGLCPRQPPGGQRHGRPAGLSAVSAAGSRRVRMSAAARGKAPLPGGRIPRPPPPPSLTGPAIRSAPARAAGSKMAGGASGLARAGGAQRRQ